MRELKHPMCGFICCWTLLKWHSPYPYQHQHQQEFNAHSTVQFCVSGISISSRKQTFSKNLILTRLIVCYFSLFYMRNENRQFSNLNFSFLKHVAYGCVYPCCRPKVKRGERKMLNHTMCPQKTRNWTGRECETPTNELVFNIWMQKGCPDSWWYKMYGWIHEEW